MLFIEISSMTGGNNDNVFILNTKEIIQKINIK